MLRTVDTLCRVLPRKFQDRVPPLVHRQVRGDIVDLSFHDDPQIVGRVVLRHFLEVGTPQALVDVILMMGKVQITQPEV